MNKKTKLLIVILLLAAALIGGFFVVKNAAVDVVFDKIYNKVIDEMIEEEKNEKNLETEEEHSDDEVYETETTEAEEGQKNETASETEPKREDTQKDKASKSSTEIAVKRISELTPQELKEIQALVTTADKATAINIVKSALTADDKREILAMLKNGKVDYGRCMQIASARLSVAQKKQIYAYYEKYANIYFANK